MEKPSILHLFTAAKNASPFDVNMAFDAGFDKIMPYTSVELAEVAGLTQDAIFSRSPSGVKREGIFIGGRDIDLAMQMLKAAKNAMFSPFACSVFADPSGAFTTAAAMIAKVETHLKAKFGEDLSGKTLSVFGATGPVGGCAAIIAAKQGANVQLVAHNSVARVEAKAQAWNSEYQISLQVVDGSSDEKKAGIVAQADIVISAAAAGVQVLSLQQLTQSRRLKIAADVNAVPPSGVEGVDVSHDGIQLAGTGIFGIGALAIGQLKYATQHALLKQMLPQDQTQERIKYLEFMAAFNLARELSNNQS
ncbi:NAD(P)-dependent methylenetetrahydromethanopterin dehydrogenase [Methylotenera sp. G11]|uniref:NAD(P)-dependent methylenetetrahydromethanopterin dehydrogenase n=1 Tax=Methylotenera sp. G11 TaxID=1506585 RepID=UPI00064876DB|nr:NAD(P)-dependent methylenetetrahydromethanopterin dehydrogenase [Methylotenera sp. G11]